MRLPPLRWLFLPILLVPLAWLLFTGLGRDPREIPSPLVGKPLPELVGTTLDGDAFSSASLLGMPLIVNVWASWCVPCVEEHPVLIDAATTHAGELAVLGVLYQDTTDAARGFLTRYGDGGWPTLLDPSGRLAVELGVTGPPETFFVNADGIVVARQIGPLTFASMAGYLADLGLSE
ncbi:MAG: redoxin family protein [Chloroflexota bacterium]|nr:redoxin family protein [Chloroflexota bacterium]